MQSSEDNKRLIIYFFYDKDGIADRYIDYMLKALRDISNKMIIVSNGAIKPATRDLFLKYSEDVIVRENKGFDVGAYKEALKYEGWENLTRYYEVVLVNSTVMGPIYPLEEMFSTMDKKTGLDFWGITKHGKIDNDPFHCNPYGYIPEHIQSYFMVLRKKFLEAKEFRKYWDNLPQINSYSESVGKFESFFTKYFGDQGFEYVLYVNNTKEELYTNQYIIEAPVHAIREDKCPFFKKRSFFQNQDYYLEKTMGEQPLELFKYLKNNTNFDTDMVLENIIRTCNQRDLVNNLGLYYVLSSSNLLNEGKTFEKELRIALIIHLYYIDLLYETLHYASAVPAKADIYINTSNEENIPAIKRAFSVLPNKVVVQLVKNRGRDVSSLLIGGAPVVKSYDLVCFYHDKKVKQLQPYSIGRSFSYLAAESALHNGIYVKNIITTFEKNPLLGMLVNLPPHNGPYYDTLGREWGPNFDNTRRLAEQLGLNIAMSPDKAPVISHGSVFWFRTQALVKLFEKKWRYEDFPDEPLASDGTFSHAVERVHSYVAQSAGFYPAYVMPDFLASIQISDFIHYTREFNIIMQSKGIYGSALAKRCQLCQSFEKISVTPKNVFPAPPVGLRRIKLVLKGRLPRIIYIPLLKLKRLILGPRNVSVRIDT